MKPNIKKLLILNAPYLLFVSLVYHNTIYRPHV